jgi:polyisoprenoid-binding protein YceI
MRKISNLIGLSVIVLLAVACSGGGPKTETRDARETKAVVADLVYSVNLSESYVAWEGYKPTGKHDGTMNLKSGKLKFSGNDLVGGEFVMDMNTIVVLDITDAGMNARLKGHLESDDFFDIEKYPTAKFVITDVEAIDGTKVDKSSERGDLVPTHAISGNLTMKDVTKNITFNAMVSREGSIFTAQTNQFFLDRVTWNVQYGSKTLFSDLKDNFINDEMGIRIHLVANRAVREMADR